MVYVETHLNYIGCTVLFMVKIDTFDKKLDTLSVKFKKQFLFIEEIKKIPT